MMHLAKYTNLLTRTIRLALALLLLSLTCGKMLPEFLLDLFTSLTFIVKDQNINFIHVKDQNNNFTLTLWTKRTGVAINRSHFVRYSFSNVPDRQVGRTAKKISCKSQVLKDFQRSNGVSNTTNQSNVQTSLPPLAVYLHNILGATITPLTKKHDRSFSAQFLGLGLVSFLAHLTLRSL